MIDSFFYALFTGSKNHMGGFLFNIGKFLAIIIIKPQTNKYPHKPCGSHTHRRYLCAGFAWLVSVFMQVFCVCDCGIVEFLVVRYVEFMKTRAGMWKQVVHIAFWGKQVLQCHSHLHKCFSGGLSFMNCLIDSDPRRYIVLLLWNHQKVPTTSRRSARR